MPSKFPSIATNAPPNIPAIMGVFKEEILHEVTFEVVLLIPSVMLNTSEYAPRTVRAKNVGMAKLYATEVVIPVNFMKLATMK